MPITELLAELSRLYEASTKGEWQTNAVPAIGSTANGVFTKPPDDELPELFVCSIKPRWEEGCIVGEEAIANADCIAALHNAFPQLLAHIATLERERDEAREALEAWADWARREPKNAGKDPLETIVVQSHELARKCCDVCCMSADISQDDVPREHPWHYDDCPVYMTVKALATITGEPSHE